MNGGEEYKEIIIMTAVYSPNGNGCTNCHYQDKGYVAAGNNADPCNVCDCDYVFEKSVILEKIIR